LDIASVTTACADIVEGSAPVSLGDQLQAAADAALTPKDRLGRLADLLERNGIDVEDIGQISKVNLWQGFYKDADGEAHTVDMAGVVLSPKWAEGPQWPVIQQGPAIKVPANTVKPTVVDGWERAVVLPDMQIGYYRTGDQLEPTHDEAAISIAIAVIKDVKPSLIVMVGDNADFPELGKYRLSPAYARTTQATIDRVTMLVAQLRQAAPGARIVYLAGNHEERLPNYILDNAAAAFGLRQGHLPDTWPVLSMPFLCRFDEFGVEYLPGYPAGSVWINQRLRVIHGDKVASGGSTAHKYLASEKTSVIYGHIHRHELAYRTREDYDGPKTIMAASPGCLARTDGAVPSTKGGIDLDGRPVVRHEDWQQGLAVVEYEPGDGRFVYEPIMIHGGWARHRSRIYVGNPL
jgi:hypothetical protein